MLTVLLNLILFTIKFIGGKISHSVAIISDAYNNLSDAVATLFSWFGLKISAVGAGEQHPNGHGRFEWVITLISSISIILIGWELLQNSIESIKNPTVPIFSIFTLIVLIISIGVKLFMYFYNIKKSKKQNSPSLKAIAIDCLSDSISTAVVLISLVVYTIFKVNIDGWCGILVSVFIMYNGFSSCLETTQMIMGHRAPIEQINELKKLILANEHFESVWNIQLEDYGNNQYRLSAIIAGKSNIDGDILLKDMADLEYLIHDKYGFNTTLSIEKDLSSTDVVNQYIDTLLKTISIPLKKLNIRIRDGREQKFVLLTLGIDHDNFQKVNQVEKEILSSKITSPDGFVLIPEIKLMQPERRRKFHK